MSSRGYHAGKAREYRIQADMYRALGNWELMNLCEDLADVNEELSHIYIYSRLTANAFASDADRMM